MEESIAQQESKVYSRDVYADKDFWNKRFEE
jgi:hypothetical protein